MVIDAADFYFDASLSDLDLDLRLQGSTASTSMTLYELSHNVFFLDQDGCCWDLLTLWASFSHHSWSIFKGECLGEFCKIDFGVGLCLDILQPDFFQTWYFDGHHWTLILVLVWLIILFKFTVWESKMCSWVSCKFLNSWDGSWHPARTWLFVKAHKKS